MPYLLSSVFEALSNLSPQTLRLRNSRHRVTFSTHCCTADLFLRRVLPVSRLLPKRQRKSRCCNKSLAFTPDKYYLLLHFLHILFFPVHKPTTTNSCEYVMGCLLFNIVSSYLTSKDFCFWSKFI